MSDPRGGVGDRRIVVVTSTRSPDSDDLWQAVRPHVGALTVIHAAGGASPHPGPGDLVLRELDGGRGLVWRHLVGLRRALRRLRPDLVHVNGELWSVTTQEVVGLGMPVVVHGAENLWYHGNAVEQRLRNALVARAARRITGYASWNRAGADHVAGLWQHRGRPPLPRLVLPAIIPPAAFRDVQWQGPCVGPGTRFEILLVGQIIPYKGFDTLVEAVSRLCPGPVRITVCGDGVAAEELTDLARARGVELELRGWVTGAELARLMARSHVQVQPSRTTPDWAEQFGRTVAEAMTVGLPCLVSECGELPHLVGGDPRALFAEGDHEHLAELLEGLRARPEALAELSRDQSVLARRYQPDDAAGSLQEFWSACLS